MAGRGSEPLDFEPYSLHSMRWVFWPWAIWFSPRTSGLENVPPRGPMLFVGNHTLHGMLDAPLLYLELRSKAHLNVRGLGDHFHYKVPAWGTFLRRLGSVPGTREHCSRMLAQGDSVLVFPGGAREVNKRKGQKYHLLWKERIGFVQTAIQAGCPIVPFASVGPEDAFDIVFDANDLMSSPIGRLLKVTGVADADWFRDGDVFPPLVRGIGLTPIPRPERFYFHFGAPIDTRPSAGLHEDREACFALRKEVAQVIEVEIGRLMRERENDSRRYLLGRLRERLRSSGRERKAER